MTNKATDKFKACNFNLKIDAINKEHSRLANQNKKFSNAETKKFPNSSRMSSGYKVH